VRQYQPNRRNRNYRILWPSNHSAGLAGSRIELGTKHESLFKVLDENAHFGGHPAACRPHRKNWHCSLKGSQKPDDGTFPEFCGEEPCWRLGNSGEVPYSGSPPGVQGRLFGFLG
jgi:hypothetical protein